MNLQVSGWSIGIISLNILLGLGVPLLLLFYCRKKYSAPIWTFFLGCGVFFLFALTLEQLVHTVVFSLAAGERIQNNIWYLALYGGMMAAIFEEGGRYLAMRFVMKKEHGNAGAALMYGAGHGGFEMFCILSLSMLNNLTYAVMMNTGMTQLLLAPLDEAMREQMDAVFRTLAATSPTDFLISPLERLFALFAQIGMSVFVWLAVTRRERRYLLPAALAAHFLLDFAAAVINGLGAPILITEAVVLLISLSIFLCACRLLRAEKRISAVNHSFSI